MLGKTLLLLKNIPAGSYVPDATKCYDDEEIQSLGLLLRKILWSPSQLRKKLQSYGITLVPNNFYSEIPSIDEIEKSFMDGGDNTYDYVFDGEIMSQFLNDHLFKFSMEFDPPVEKPSDGGFYWKNPAFSFSDAMSYYCFIRHAAPRTIIEIGSGWSTLVAAAACKANGAGRIICVEPAPKDFIRKIVPPISIIEWAFIYMIDPRLNVG